MTHVELKPNGVLEFTNYDVTGIDVSDDAVGYLFELVQLGEGLRVCDVFLLLKRNPALLPIFRRCSAEELLAEAFSGEPDPYDGTYNAENIEYVELWRCCNINPSTKIYWQMSRLDITGIGFELREPWEDEQGNRIKMMNQPEQISY